MSKVMMLVLSLSALALLILGSYMIHPGLALVALGGSILVILAHF